MTFNNSQVPHWRQEDGRRVRDRYVFTNDAQECARLNAQHQLFKLAWGRNFWAPIEPLFAQDAQLPPEQRPLRRILDVGCGTAIWGVEVFHQLHKAGIEPQLINLDIDNVPIKKFLPQAFRSHKLHPDDCGVIEINQPLPDRPPFLFVQADASKTIPFADNTFDFAHARLPDPYLSEEGWPQFIRELTRVTKPTGWVELLVADWYYTGQRSEAVDILRDAGTRLASLWNLAPLGGPKLPLYLQQAGVSTKIITHTVGKTKKQQLLLLKDMLHVERQAKGAFLKYGILTEETFEQVITQFEQDARKSGFFQKLHRICFQPKDSGETTCDLSSGRNPHSLMRP